MDRRNFLKMAGSGAVIATSSVERLGLTVQLEG